MAAVVTYWNVRGPAAADAPQGEVADPANTPPGCHFHPRCKYAQAICKDKAPVQEEIAPNHFVSCHRARELTLRGVARWRCRGL